MGRWELTERCHWKKKVCVRRKPRPARPRMRTAPPLWQPWMAASFRAWSSGQSRCEGSREARLHDACRANSPTNGDEEQEQGWVAALSKAPLFLRPHCLPTAQVYLCTALSLPRIRPVASCSSRVPGTGGHSPAEEATAKDHCRARHRGQKGFV